MPMLSVVENLDDIDEALKAQYIEKTYRLKSTFRDGVEKPGDEVKRFVLQVGGVQEHPDVIALANAHERTKNSRQKLQQEFDALKAKFEGLPDDFTIEQYETLKAAADATEGDPAGESPEDKKKRLEQGQAAIRILEQKLERITKEKDGVIKQKDEKIASLNRFINKLMVDEGLSKALDEAGVAPKFKKAAMAMLRENCKIEGDGDDRHAVYETSDVGTVDLPRFVREWAAGDDGKEFVAKPKGGGAGGGEGDRRDLREGEKNPFAKKTEEGHNLTRQAQIRQQDPAKAKRLAKEAGWTDGEIKQYFPDQAA